MTVDELVALKHAAPFSNRDFDFFYSGLEGGALLAQKCSDCGTLRNPPAPMCAGCASLEWTVQELSGRGTVYSYIVHYHPPLQGFDNPHGVIIAELEEGVRFVGALNPADREDVAIGKPVKIEFIRRGEIALFQFALDREGR